MKKDLQLIAEAYEGMHFKEISDDVIVNVSLRNGDVHFNVPELPSDIGPMPLIRAFEQNALETIMNAAADKGGIMRMKAKAYRKNNLVTFVIEVNVQGLTVHSKEIDMGETTQ